MVQFKLAPEDEWVTATFEDARSFHDVAHEE